MSRFFVFEPSVLERELQTRLNHCVVLAVFNSCVNGVEFQVQILVALGSSSPQALSGKNSRQTLTNISSGSTTSISSISS